MRFVASVSFGKDSLAMLLKLLETNTRLDEVVFYNTGVEFDAMYDARDKVIPMLEERGIKYTELHPEKPFEYWMFEHPVKKKDTDEVHKIGYSWCGGVCRWGTRQKTAAINKHLKQYKLSQIIHYIGIAADEYERVFKGSKGRKMYPLIDWGMTEADCLQYCYDHGFYFEDNGVRLYDVIHRASCWCCRNIGVKQLKQIYLHLPKYWNKLKDFQSRTYEPFNKRAGGIFELDERFMYEKECEKYFENKK